MRLADQIVAAAKDRRSPLQPDYERLAAAVMASTRFEVDAEAAGMAAAIGKSNARQLREARAFARTPFRSLWVEWLGSSGDYYGHGVEPLEPGQTRPIRTGMLIETDESMQRGTITQVWSGKEPNGRVVTEPSPLCVTFDWREVHSPVPTLARREGTEPYFLDGPRNEREQRVFEKIRMLTPEENRDVEERHGYVPNPRLVMFQRMMANWALSDPAGARQRFATVLGDWAGEINFLYAFLVSINSRNLLQIEAGDDLAKLNKARRRLGRPELLAFSTVRLSLSQAMRRKAAAAAGAGDIRAHLVRGHFKLRKTGAFWWSPFVRGDAARGVVMRRGYEVTA